MAISIVDYDPQWPDQFNQLKVELAAALGDLAIAIEHIGSTSVPGLAAKPVIDIDIVIKSLAELPIAIERLASIGYEHRGDLGIVGREAFTSPPGEPARHLYVCARDAVALREHLAFRDYLRKKQPVAATYAALKRRIAASCEGDRVAYTEQKTTFVRDVLSRCPIANFTAAL